MATSNELMNSTDEESLIFQRLLMEAVNKEKINGSSEYHSIIPKPGFCLKTKSDKDGKVFINICTAENLPEPKDITDEELIRLLDSDDPTGYRIPLSLGEPHAELDKNSKGCTAYDVIINPNFYELIHKRSTLMGFFLTVVLEGLENKYSISLDRNYRILKNRHFFGSLPEQNVRSRSKPWIMEMESQQDKSALISEISYASCDKQPLKAKSEEPLYILMKEPAELHPEYLVAEVQLPKVKVAASLTLDVGEDRILLQTRSGVYHLDIYLPYRIIQEECVSQFSQKTKILTITMPVQPNDGSS